LSSSVRNLVARLLIPFGAIASALPPAYAQSPNVHLRIGLIVAPNAAPALAVARGVRLGASESKQTAVLFGADVELYEVSASGPSAVHDAASSLLSRRKVQILISATAEDADALSSFADSHNLLFLNAASRSGSLRLACRRNTFHVEAPDVAYRNARALRRMPTDANGKGMAATDSESVVLWSPLLERFGASQLNARYRAMFGTGMDGGGWAGWAAVKIATEAALRARSTVPARLLAYLEAPATQFDGHKGWPLTFRRADHQLRQPLYIVATSSKAAREPGPNSIQDVPDIRQVSDGNQTPSTLLDKLNARPGIRACAWPPL
jgi:hypothetical protein